MQVVHSYNLKIVDEQEIKMPVVSDILTVGFQGTNPVLWARIDPSSDTIVRKIFLVGTGGVVPPGLTYINSILMPSEHFVLHWWRDSI